MRFSVITPSYNSGRFLERTIESVLAQKVSGVELEYIIIDGKSTDITHSILDRYKHEFAQVVIEPDRGPAHAINKGLARATGDVVSWLNADDIYFPNTLFRVGEMFENNPALAFLFGRCPIIDEDDQEIRGAITHFKEFFFPLSTRFTYQCINYISQPALFFRRTTAREAGWLREDMIAAWDYEYILRLWSIGPAACLTGDPLAAFRWYEGSISGQHFNLQFQEEFEAARQDAGLFSLQTALHFFIRWGIVGVYGLMSRLRTESSGDQEQ